MPIYSFQCEACETQFDRMMKMSEKDNPTPCPECEEMTSKRLVTGCNFNLPGDGWASKNGRVQKQMAERRRRLGIKQHERVADGGVPGGKLVPNVGGEWVETWSEATKLATPALR